MNPMMKTLVVVGVLALGLFAVAPTAEAAPAPLPCTAQVGTGSGYVACCPVGVSVSYGGTYRCPAS